MKQLNILEINKVSGGNCNCQCKEEVIYIIPYRSCIPNKYLGIVDNTTVCEMLCKDSLKTRYCGISCVEVVELKELPKVSKKDS